MLPVTQLVDAAALAAVVSVAVGDESPVARWSLLFLWAFALRLLLLGSGWIVGEGA
jgi:hypothetical protein